MMMKLAATIAFALLVVFSTTSQRASADDFSDIQAAVTAFMTTTQHVQQPGVFGVYTVIENYPYASVQAGIGTLGYSSESFALSKTSGAWKILLNGGGVMGVSEFVSVGIPLSNAQNLQGFSCPPELRRVPPFAQIVNVARGRGERTVLPRGLVSLARTRGPSVLPRRTVRIVYQGRLRDVTILQPFDARRCAL